jgi:hypothetical protein
MLIENESRPSLKLDYGTYLGPARVHRVAGNRIQLEFPDELPWATLALAYPYQPAVGDTILAVGQGPTWFVIGVIQGSGNIRFIVPGDFEVIAPKGHITLFGGQGIHVKSPEVKITAGKLELVAKRFVEHFTDAARWVRNTWHVRAARVRLEVKEDYRLKANSINERAEDAVKIDGRKIHLG